MILAEARSIWGRRAAERRVEALSPERRREIASMAGKAAAARISPEARRARAMERHNGRPNTDEVAKRTATCGDGSWETPLVAAGPHQPKLAA
jgi:hypothetical protein